MKIVDKWEKGGEGRLWGLRLDWVWRLRAEGNLPAKSVAGAAGCTWMDRKQGTGSGQHRHLSLACVGFEVLRRLAD